jgi:hypothetical protein
MQYAIASVTISYAGAEPGKKIFKYLVDPNKMEATEIWWKNFTHNKKEAWTTTSKKRAWAVLSDFYNLRGWGGNPRISQRVVYATKIYRVDCKPPVLIED